MSINALISTNENSHSSDKCIAVQLPPGKVQVGFLDDCCEHNEVYILLLSGMIINMVNTATTCKHCLPAYSSFIQRSFFFSLWVSQIDFSQGTGDQIWFTVRRSKSQQHSVCLKSEPTVKSE